MLADDHVDFRQTVAFHLAMAGYPVLEASSVSAIVAQARDLRPDLVVLSDDLAEGDVGGLLQSLRRDADLRGVPVITLSSEPGTARLVECLASGARDHVRRQDGADELVARVDAVIRADDELERLRRRNAELEFLGTTDVVTGLSNRRQIEEEHDRLRASASRHALPLSVAMVRVDAFGEPHSRADAKRRDSVIRELGYLIAAVRRADDFVGVWDPATFVLLLPMTPLEGVLAFVTRLQSVVTAAPVQHGSELVPVTLSASCAQVRDGAAGILHRLERAVETVQAHGGASISVTA
jgi:diguanylate cyclase (GGDEF)-like protein